LSHTFFATCGPGIEPVLHEECRGLRLPRTERQVGGVRFEGSMREARRACLWLRTAVRVRRWLARFPCPDGDALYRAVSEVDWRMFVSPRGTLVVDALSRDSQLTHTQFVEQRTKDAIVDQLRARHGTRPSVVKDSPELRVHVHLFRDRATLAVDCGGESLHKRGWRVHQGLAPLSETYAAAIVILSGWNRRAPLIDPFCGAGTILVEAGLLARNFAPGLFRETFGFERWADHDADSWKREREEARGAAVLPAKLRLVGRDLDPERVAEALENAEAAGVGGFVDLSVGDARDIELRRGWNAWIVSNLPYGQRVGHARSIERLMADIGAKLREEAAGYTVALLAGDPRHEEALALPRARRLMLRNGALEVGLLQATL
jgi:23S rRNA G2445 N2-methylase RlmL